MLKMPHWPIPMGSKPIDLNLSRVKSLLNQLGNPEQNLPPVIHVAGTNGKGSTCAFLKAIFQSANFKVHSYTSPHLVNFNERINILGTDIDDGFLHEVLEECRFASEKINIEPTFFEGTTVAAFLAFSKIKADVIILEVGMGGRLDATNVIDNPAMSIITSIAFDHMEFLGDSLVKIAIEKAGIIKQNAPCVISKQYPEVSEVLLGFAEERNAHSYAFEYDWIVRPNDNVGFIYESLNNSIVLPELSLKGEHQYINAGNAITAALNLKDFNITHTQIIRGITNAFWPARLQKLSEGAILAKLPKNIEVWVDGAHNEAGAYVVSSWLKNQPLMPTYMMCGMTKGRDCQKFLSNFVSKIEHVAGVLIEAEPASYGGKHIANEAKSQGFNSSEHNSIEEGFAHLVEIINKDRPARIIVCGSLYLAGDLLYKNQRFIKR